MQTIILLSLTVLGANAYWGSSEYSNEWSEPPQKPPSHWEQRRPENYPSRFFPNILSQSQSQQKSAIDAYVAEAEWVCNNPKTGDILILAPSMKDQIRRPVEKPTNIFENEQSQHDTTDPGIQTTDKFQPPTGPHGGEGIINTRIGDA